MQITNANNVTVEQLEKQCTTVLLELDRISEMLSVLESKLENQNVVPIRTDLSSTIAHMLRMANACQEVRKRNQEVSMGVSPEQNEPEQNEPEQNEPDEMSSYNDFKAGKWEFNGSTTGATLIVR